DDRNVRELFLNIAVVILQRYVVLQHSGENLEVGNASGERVGQSLKDEGGRGLVVSTFAGHGLAITTDRLPGDGVMLAGCGRVVDDEIHQFVNADVAEARGEEHGKQLVFANRFVQRG